VVVGPYGAEQQALFELVQASGVTMATPVVLYSAKFMLETVIPWVPR